MCWKFVQIVPSAFYVPCRITKFQRLNGHGRFNSVPGHYTFNHHSVVRHTARYGITVILMRFHFDERKSGRLRANPKRGIGFEEAQEVFSHPYYLDQRTDCPEQYRAIGWVGEQLYTVILEVREDEEGEYYHLVTLWRATKQEQQLYGEHS